MNDNYCSLCGINDLDINSKTCTKCKYILCDVCMKNGDMCKECFDSLCPICNKIFLNGDCNDEKYCKKCNRVCCINCIALTGCQTVDGTCINCFDFICTICHKNQLQKKCYLEDHNEYQPICNNCKI